MYPYWLYQYYVTSGAHAITIGPWTLSLIPENENLAYCVAQHDSIVLDIGQGLYPGNLYDEFIYDVEGGTTDTMLILQWDFDYSGSSLVCGEIVSTPIIKDIDLLYKWYPNPTFNSITIEWKDIHAQPNDIRVFSSDGQLVRNFVIDNLGTNQIQIDASKWISGLYLIQLITDTHEATRKILKY